MLFYVDDLLIYSEMAEEHLKHLELVFQKFWESGLKLKLSECTFFKSQIEYLGHLISSKGISPLPDKIQAIANLKRPRNITQKKHILGMVSYYRQFFPILSETVRPINRITHKSVPHEWTYTHENSLKCIQDFITTEPILKYLDPNLPYILYTDSSKYTWSGILMQKQMVDLPDSSQQEIEVQITNSLALLQNHKKNGQLSRKKHTPSMPASRKWFFTSKTPESWSEVTMPHWRSSFRLIPKMISLQTGVKSCLPSQVI